MRTTSSSFALAATSLAASLVCVSALVACGSSKDFTAGATPLGDDSGSGITPSGGGNDSGSIMTTLTTGNDAGGGGTIMTTSDSGTGGGDDSSDAGAGGDGAVMHAPQTAHHPVTTAPTRTCSTTKDYGPGGNYGDGYISMMSSAGAYWVHLPTSYDGTKPMPVVIGTHGCSDDAEHFDSWAIDPYSDNGGDFASNLQKYIAVSVEDVSGDCWNLSDTSKILTALDDVATCFYVDQSRVTMAGYSSGAAAAYQTALAHAERFNGLLIECGGLYDTGSAEDGLLANATWRINIAHIAHQQDEDYPLAQVQTDWATILTYGFPLVTTVDPPGDNDENLYHAGSYHDWANILIPNITNWTAPE